MTISRNYEYELWMVTVGAAQGDVEALRAEWDEAIAADRAERGLGPEPEPEPEPSGSWLSNITPSLLARAWRPRQPAASYASRADLLSPSRSVSISDRFGGTDYADHLDRGGFKK
jgi:hypothetical protein